MAHGHMQTEAPPLSNMSANYWSETSQNCELINELFSIWEFCKGFNVYMSTEYVILVCKSLSKESKDIQVFI